MWYVLNYLPPAGHRRSALPLLVERFAKALHQPLELFAPTFVKVETREGTPRRVERPLLYHYIFLRGSESAVKSLCRTFEGFSFVMSHTAPGRHLTIDDDTMHAFRQVARLHGNRLTCFPLDGVQLEEGDRVQVVTGQFAGLTGTYISKRGGRSGNLVIAVTQAMSAVLYDIHVDSIRVLEFAPDSRRVYDQMDAFVNRLLPLLAAPEPPAVGSAAHTALVLFSRRLGSVRLDNPKAQAKLQMLLYAAYALLGETDDAARARERYEQLSANVTNVWTRALALLIFGSLLPDERLLRQARAQLEPLPPRLSAIQRLILSSLPS